MTVAFMLAACVSIGVSMGLSGIGGFLVAPAMLVIARTSVGEAILAALLVNLAVMVTTGFVAIVRAHIAWSVLSWLALGSVVAAFGSGSIVTALSEEAARIVIAVFLAGAGTMVLVAVAPRPKGRARLRMMVLGAAAQLSAVLAGIGGPAITVPALSARGELPLNAIGTGLLHGVLVSLVGIWVTLRARSMPVLDVQVLTYAAVVVAVALLTNIARARIASPTFIRYVVGLSALAGSLFTLISR